MSVELLKLDSREFTTAFRQGGYDSLSERFIEIFEFFSERAFVRFSPEEQGALNEFVRVFLYLFTKREYQVNARYCAHFIHFNPVISNLTALTPQKTTDRQLEMLRTQDGALFKILTLLSPRNSIQFNVADFFDTNVYMASVWYSIYFYSVEGSPTRMIHENQIRHQHSLDKRWMIVGATKGGSSVPYFISTYIDPLTEQGVRSHINQSIRPMFAREKIRNTPRKKSIAILSTCWYRGSAVYRSVSRYVEALRPDYDLTLIQLSKASADFDQSLFSDIRTVQFDFAKGTYDLTAIKDNDFALAFFTDIGMQEEDRYLSNLRFAPIQITGYGHPVSSWGGDIDYYIGGRSIENGLHPEKRYSERLVLIPGIGLVPSYPNYQPQGVQRREDGRVIINCPWTAQKCHYPHLLTLRTIIERSEKKLLFRFTGGRGLHRNNAFLPFVQDISEVLGEEHVEVLHEVPYSRFMELLEEGDFTIDAWPFAGYNTLIDSLWLVKPWVSREGEMFINRASSALLRQVGLDELITHSEEEYIERVLRMIHDDDWRMSLQKKLRVVDLEQTVFAAGYEAHFKQAVDYLIDNHKQLATNPSRDPIFIE